jgi:hypothetical protein
MYVWVSETSFFSYFIGWQVLASRINSSASYVYRKIGSVHLWISSGFHMSAVVLGFTGLDSEVCAITASNVAGFFVLSC